MKNIIESLWKKLDRLFLPRVKPSGDLLNELITHSIVSFSNRDRLKDFSTKCRLMDFTVFDSRLNQVYDTPQTIDGFCCRLDSGLFKDWVNEKHKLEKPDEEVSLKDFSKWICGLYKKKQGEGHILNPENKEGPSSNSNTSNRRSK